MNSLPLKMDEIVVHLYVHISLIDSGKIIFVECV